MKKANIAIVVGLIAILAVFVSAAIIQQDGDETVEPVACESKITEESQCNGQTCNQQCGGTCGMPRCGCSK